MTALPWADWLDEDRTAPAPRMVRPSLELDAALIARVDRVARISGLSRSVLVAHILDRWLASWRPLHQSSKRMASGELSYTPPRRRWLRRKPGVYSWKCFECGATATGFSTMDENSSAWRRHLRKRHGEGPQPIKPNPGVPRETGFDWPWRRPHDERTGL